MSFGEILAPAGSFEALRAAVNCGANAVYIGGKNFSARQNAANFDDEQLKEAVRFCHLRNVKLYITVNTIILDSQFEEFAAFVKTAAEYGVDAFIVQDFGAAEIIRAVVPDAVLHGSTQMTVHTVNGALFLKEKGFKRVVLSRELSERTIKEITSLGIETEVFVHGALCMSVSGQCYMSAFIGQRSANRGLCAQPCRLPFSACKTPDYTALSLKDLTLTKHLLHLSNMGVTSFKIEGRMKRPEYVASAVKACKDALNGGIPDIPMLKSVFSRNGFTDGYFTGKLYDMFGHREKEDVVAAAKLLPEIKKQYEKDIKTAEINFHAVIKNDCPAELTASSGNCKITVSGCIPEKAINKPLDEEYLCRQLSKLGGTVFDFGKLTCDIDKGLILSAKEINALRRLAVEKLSEEIISSNTPEYKYGSFDKSLKNNRESLCQIRMRISDISQYEAVKDADFVIMPTEVFLDSNIQNRDNIIIEPPRFITDESEVTKTLEKCREKGAKRLICNNISYLKTGKDMGFLLHGDFGLNISNSESLDFFKKNNLEDATLSIELKLSQINGMNKDINTGIVAYGYMPLMLTRNCPVKNETGCKNCKKSVFDRTGRENRIVCYNKKYVEILNSQPIYMADRMNEIKNVSFITLYFTNESSFEVKSVINEYKGKYSKRDNITRGLYYRGII